MIKKFFVGRKRGDILFDCLIILLSISIFLIIAYPLYFVVIASISDSNMVSKGLVTLFPKNISFYGFGKILQDERIWTGYRNTLIYTLGGTIINLVFTLPAAYALSRQEFKVRKPLMFIFTFTMFFNGGLIPTYLLYKEVGLIDSMWVFIIPSAINVYNLIIARSFFETSIPDSLYEAASLDGCSYFKFFLTVAIPLSKAVISVVGLYYLVQHWNDFFTGLVFIRSYEKQPLQIVLRDILLSNQTSAGGAGALGDGYGQQFADQIKYGAIIVSTLPVLVIYPFLQKYFDKGVMIGAMKG